MSARVFNITVCIIFVKNFPINNTLNIEVSHELILMS